ncbi:PPPDE peptidase domain [Dillenia turbinata]|uniref:PPPDE peptidase domain n=1 Tax=Dillenia turbinata TaxID=194707 RepID=A0AAN8YTL2_9MAGN
MWRRILPDKRKTGAVPVYLNVYDLTSINGYAYWLGLGVYHSGVQVHGIEYGFGAHDHSATGVFEVEPKHCPGFVFRKSVLIGRTDLGPREVRTFMEKLAEEYSGNSYNLITKNCNHFCNDACVRLTGKTIPRWVNRLARLGFLCNCVLPANLQETKVRHIRAENTNNAFDGDKKKLRSNSSRFVSGATNAPPPSLSSSSSQKSRRQRHHPSSTSLIISSKSSNVKL